VPGIEPTTPDTTPEVGSARPAPDTELGLGPEPEPEPGTEPGTEIVIESDAAPDDGAETESSAATGPDATTTATRRRLLVPALALALSLALLATLLLVTREDPAQRSRDASAASATARSTLEQILSYNHATMTQQVPANQALLTGTFKDEFAATMTKTIVPLATKDKTVVKARAYEVGVMSQRDGTVTVQAFVDQARTSDAQKEPSIDQNRVIATMTKVGNRWLISALKAY
jgi:Mce-associated membrane protein